MLYLADERKQESLDGFWPTLTPAQRDGIAAVATDMWEPYVQSTRAHLPGADGKIVFDKFHVVSAFEGTRRHERRDLAIAPFQLLSPRESGSLHYRCHAVLEDHGGEAVRLQGDARFLRGR